jgi:two-component system osmolarity sensor histidine kinase EnvZ
MRLGVRTLFGRNVLLLLVLFMFGLLCGLLALRQWVQKPRVTQLAVLAERQIRWAQAGLEALPVEHRGAMRPWLNSRSGVLVVPVGAVDPPPELLPRGPITRQFLDDLRRRLSETGSDVRWIPKEHGTLWVRFLVGREAYWFIESGVQPEGELPATALGLMVLTAVLSVAGAILIQRRLNRPLSRLAQAADDLAKGAPAPRLSEEAPAEIATVARAFNQMSASLAQLDAERTVMLAGVSHDLRTPLAKMRLAIEMLSKDGDATLISSMLRSAEEMDAIIDQFLDYARAASAEEARYADLNALIRECVERYTTFGHVLRLSLQDLPELPLRLQSIKRAIENLIENALRYGGTDLLIESKLLSKTARLSVLDRGPGISAGEIETLKKPFARGSSSVGIAGSGLGLAIVERIVHAHGGVFALLPRDGGGLEARIDLPLALRDMTLGTAEGATVHVPFAPIATIANSGVSDRNEGTRGTAQ